MRPTPCDDEHSIVINVARHQQILTFYHRNCFRKSIDDHRTNCLFTKQELNLRQHSKKQAEDKSNVHRNSLSRSNVHRNKQVKCVSKQTGQMCTETSRSNVHRNSLTGQMCIETSRSNVHRNSLTGQMCIKTSRSNVHWNKQVKCASKVKQVRCASKQVKCASKQAGQMCIPTV